HPFLQQVLVDVNEPRARKDLVELITRELVVARTTTDDDRLDIEVVQRIRNPVKENPVVRDDLIRLVGLAAASLRITAAEITWRQNGLDPDMPEHRLRCEANLREKSLGTASGKVEHCFGIRRGTGRITDDRNVVAILDVEQGACCPAR